MTTRTVTTSTFAPLIAQQGIVVLDWWAAWCGPCRVFGPVFEKVSQAHPDVVFGKINVDEEPQLAGSLAVQSIPTVSVFRDGALLFHQPGMLSEKALVTLLEKIGALEMAKVHAVIAEAERKEKEKATKPEGGTAPSGGNERPASATTA